ncbi:competence type IV pilus minor pilin ComGD [Bacillus pumilus]|nr:competence type IV pilus minor pilin ComGD [Bacillus pumilus]OLP64595.1 hypothetical protein BACPU_25190 [Bacillus pumilus]
MNRFITHDKGFTLIEQLLILLVLSILLSVVVGKVPTVLESVEAKRQVNIIKQDIQLASYTAFVKKARVNVEFDDSPNISYHVINQQDARIVTTYQHKKGIIKQSTFQQTIQFNANGHPSSGGSLIFQFGRQIYKLTVYLGSGRIHVQKQ